MVYIPNFETKRKLRLAKKEYEKEEQKRKKESRKLFLQWQKENPGKGLMDYIMRGSET